MREIKFRAWDRINNIMALVNVYTYSNPSKITYLTDLSEISLYQPDFELMQFTGLKDKNGKEIYEGDIITNYGITNEMKARKYQIVFTDERARFSAYDLSSRWGTSISSYDMRQCEVIGNVYENPELLN